MSRKKSIFFTAGTSCVICMCAGAAYPAILRPLRPLALTTLASLSAPASSSTLIASALRDCAALCRGVPPVCRGTLGGVGRMRAGCAAEKGLREAVDGVGCVEAGWSLAMPPHRARSRHRRDGGTSQCLSRSKVACWKAGTRRRSRKLTLDMGVQDEMVSY